MVTIGADLHKRSHTLVAVDERGRKLAERTRPDTPAGHLALLRWATEHFADRTWALEDCRHLGRGVERDLLAAGETTGIGRFRSRAAFARHNGTAPVPVWSGNQTRHRLSRGGNRQLNVALHRIAVTQLQRPGRGRDYVEKRTSAGDTRTEAIRALRRRISDAVYHRMRDDEALHATATGQAHLTPAA